MAIFANEFYQLIFNGLEPTKGIAIISLLVAFMLLGRLLIAILFVEHIMRQHNAGVDKNQG